MISSVFRPIPPRVLAALAFVAISVLAPFARATSVVPPSFDQLVAQSDYIVQAVVTNISSEVVADARGRHIISHIALDVKRVISGNPPQPLVLQVLGGKVGSEEMIVTGAPRFAVGDEDILFLRGNGRQFNPLVGLMHGRYPVRHDSQGRDYITRSNGSPLYDTGDVALPMGTASQVKAAHASAPPLSVSDFISRIQTAVTQHSRGSIAN
jgi:hypothetical protein